jgi:hypothetical protein
VSFELLLPVGAIAFYVLDSAALLFGNEFIFAMRAGRWTFSQGTDLVILGRRIYIPNPITPQAFSFRVYWSESQHRSEMVDLSQIRDFLVALRPLGFLVQFLLALLLLVLPGVLYWRGTGMALLVVFAAAYLTVLIMLALTYSRRARLKLSVKGFLALALDALACPPFAINLVRKISLRYTLCSDPVEFAMCTFSTATFEDLISAICKRLDQDISNESAESVKWNALQSYRQRLMSMVL